MRAFRRATLETCADLSGTVVVIDMLRAFTTAAYAFGAGAEAVTVVADVDEAFALLEEHPGWLITGEEHGLPVQGFDLGNSPATFLNEDLAGRHLVQRTSSGTQGVVRSAKADQLLATSLCCAHATADVVCRLRPERVTFAITGSHPGALGDEDKACADCLEALMRGEDPDRAIVIQRVRESRAAQNFQDPARPESSPSDLERAVDVDRFSFAMVVRHQAGAPVMHAVRATSCQ